MNKEELKQKLNNEASLYCQEYATLETYDSVHKAYIFSAEPRENQLQEKDKKIAELEAQIEKMKCCGNCKYSNQEGVYTIVCKVGGVDKTDYIEIEDNQVCEKWELRR